MKRLRYPSGEFLFQGKKIEEGTELVLRILEELRYPVVKKDLENEGVGTMIVAVNKTTREILSKERPSHMIPILGPLIEEWLHSEEAFDPSMHKIGIEVYLWPVDDGVLAEVFVMPYMEHLDRPEILMLTESRTEEAAEWHLCNVAWREMSAGLKGMGAERRVMFT